MSQNDKTAPRPDRDRRARFARELARAELGRHYFDDRIAREIRRAMKKEKPGAKRPK